MRVERNEGKSRHKQLHGTATVHHAGSLRRRKESDAIGECVTNHSPQSQIPRASIHLGESGNDISAAEDK